MDEQKNENHEDKKENAERQEFSVKQFKKAGFFIPFGSCEGGSGKQRHPPNITIENSTYIVPMGLKIRITIMTTVSIRYQIKWQV